MEKRVEKVDSFIGGQIIFRDIWNFLMNSVLVFLIEILNDIPVITLFADYVCKSLECLNLAKSDF